MSTTNGVGTRYYGKANKRRDGSYVATKWLVLFWVPLVPLGSARLHDVQRTSGLRGTPVSTYTSFKAEAVRLHRLQVLRTYGYAVVLTPAGWLALDYISAH